MHLFRRDPSSPRTVSAEVVHVEDLTPRWKRIVIDAPEAEPYLKPHFERAIEGGFIGAFHMAFFFPVSKAEAVSWPRLSGPFADIFDVDGSLYEDPDVELVSRRMYTVRQVDDGYSRLEMNFSLHDGDGLGMDWAKRAQVGMRLLIDMGARVVDVDEFPTVGTYLLIGDETSIPSIATMLKRIPAGRTAHVCIEVADAEDEWPLDAEHLDATIEWLHRGDKEAGTTDFLTDYCKKFTWPEDDFYIWAAAEGRKIYALRQYLRNEMGLDRTKYQLMGYWRKGVRTEKVLEIEGNHINARLAAGLSPFDMSPDRDRVTPHEGLEID